MKFPKLVIEEAIALRKHTIRQELDRLDFNTLDPEHFERCIYGKMTGSCFSPRATYLIEKCALKVYDNEEYREMCGVRKVCNGVKLNGSPIGLIREFYFSPIEVFISRHPSQKGAGKLIQFIKGEIESL